MTDYPNEIYECAKWLETTLKADNGVGGLFHAGAQQVNGAYMDLIPEDVKLPAIRFHVQAQSTVRGVGPGHIARIMTDLLWLIVVVREGHEIAPIVPIVSRLDTVLDGMNGSTSLVNVQSCVLVEPFQLLETDKSGVQVRHAGGLYRTIVVPK